MVGTGEPISAAVMTACTPGIARAAAVSIGADVAVRDRAAQDGRMQQPRPGDIVDVLAAPAQEAKIFDALDGAADERICRPRYF